MISRRWHGRRCGSRAEAKFSCARRSDSRLEAHSKASAKKPVDERGSVATGIEVYVVSEFAPGLKSRREVLKNNESITPVRRERPRLVAALGFVRHQDSC